jgi:hypothetical protein
MSYNISTLFPNFYTGIIQDFDIIVDENENNIKDIPAKLYINLKPHQFIFIAKDV